MNKGPIGENGMNVGAASAQDEKGGNELAQKLDEATRSMYEAVVVNKEEFTVDLLQNYVMAKAAVLHDRAGSGVSQEFGLTPEELQAMAGVLDLVAEKCEPWLGKTRGAHGDPVLQALDAVKEQTQSADELIGRDLRVANTSLGDLISSDMNKFAPKVEEPTFVY